MYFLWLSSGPGQGPGPEPGRTGCMVLRTATEQEPEQGHGRGRMGYVPIFQVLKLFQVVCFNCISMVFRCPACVNGFCIVCFSPGPRDSQCEYTSTVTFSWFSRLSENPVNT